MTLPELLVTMAVLGIVVTVIAAAIIVTLRQDRVSAGRFDLARAEQSVGIWLPGDLSSADKVSTDPWLSPCGATNCDGIDLSKGSNVLMLTWMVDGVETNVSYHFRPSSDGGYELVRVACTLKSEGWSCDAIVLLRDLAGPPGGAEFVPGVGLGEDECKARDADESAGPRCTRPTWVVQVSAPLVYDEATGEEVAATGDQVKDANRVLVTIYDDSGATSSGFSQVTITAGGTTRRTISANSMLGAPTLTAVRSRCGGPITVVVDVSQSIGSENVTNVKNAVKAFANALIGTPVQIQIVEFHTRTRVLGTDGWRKYFDMTKIEDVDALTAAIDTIALAGTANGNGYTNWEEALFRALYDPEDLPAGKPEPTITSQLPETVVFFTDGIPTRDRLDAKTAPANGDPLPLLPELGGQGGYGTKGTEFSQVSFNRAEYMARRFRNDVRMIGVGVGSFGNSNTSQWVTTPGAPLYNTPQARQTWTYQQRQYQVRQNWTRQTNIVSHSALYWVRDSTAASSPWRPVNRSTYDGVSTAGLKANWLVRSGNSSPWLPQYNAGTPGGSSSDRSRVSDNTTSITRWPSTNATQYQAANPDGNHTNNTDAGRSDGLVRSTGSWAAFSGTAAQFAALDTVAGDSDGYRKRDSSGSWVSVGQAEYDFYANSPYSQESGGYRIDWPTFSGTAAQFAALDTVAGQSDGYRKQPSGSNNWVNVSQAEYDFYATSSYQSEREGYRIQAVAGGSGNPDSYGAPTTASRRNSAILTHFITGIGPIASGPNAGQPGVAATVPGAGGQYDLEEVKEASMFFPTNWATEFPKAMQAIALGECGGTLTLQTRVTNAGNQPAQDPVEYVNVWTRLKDQPRVKASSEITTNLSATASTFDFLIPSGQYIDVGVVVNNHGELDDNYEHVDWECRAGPDFLEAPDFVRPSWPEDSDLELSEDWPGFEVKVAANEAVSCTQWVTLKSSP